MTHMHPHEYYRKITSLCTVRGKQGHLQTQSGQ